ncbi:P. aeruginosa PAGI-11 island-related protein [Oleispira antarctica RB-8]|uniref:P. aeruginosa PAGI-11 island-related protein n=1 Tax=Oleispira antarctica RB-8 TaxID=698738 RepID=R4YMF2_OLEAN|nr:P. aeruginosa PAGI-11 island-related protein [Oleispira antarctica RB-8]
MSKQNNESTQDVMHELVDTFDEYVVCMTFATKDIREYGEKLTAGSFSNDHQMWIGSDLDSNPKMHARIKTVECIEKCKENSGFSNEIRKSLLCTMYSLWDELYRHRVAAASNMEAKDLICPIMGDMRKIRHCIIHHKSIVPETGISFEVLDWELSPGRLEITHEHFLDFNDAVRGERMKIHSCKQSPEMEKIFQLMTKKERRRFEDFYKIKGNRENDVEWPGLKQVLNRIEQAKCQKSESEA